MKMGVFKAGWQSLACKGAIDRSREHCSLFRTLHDGQSSPPLSQPFLKPERYWQLISSVFKTLTDQTVIVELKNDLLITGVLKSVDQSVTRVSPPSELQPAPRVTNYGCEL